MTDLEQQGHRLYELILALKTKKTAFAKSIKLSQGYISLVISGKKRISATVIKNISKRYAYVNIHWLLTGEGDMIMDKKEPTVNQVNEDRMEYNRTKGEDGPLESFMNLLKDQERLIKDLLARVERIEKRLE